MLTDGRRAETLDNGPCGLDGARLDIPIENAVHVLLSFFPSLVRTCEGTMQLGESRLGLGLTGNIFVRGRDLVELGRGPLCEEDFKLDLYCLRFLEKTSILSDSSDVLDAPFGKPFWHIIGGRVGDLADDQSDEPLQIVLKFGQVGGLAHPGLGHAIDRYLVRCLATSLTFLLTPLLMAALPKFTRNLFSMIRRCA